MGKVKAESGKRKAGEGTALLEPLLLAALKLAVTKDAEKTRDRLEAVNGQEVDETVRVRGVVHVAPGSQAEITKRPKAELLLGVALEALGPANRGKVEAAIVAAAASFVASGEGPEVSTQAQALAEDLLRRVERKELQERRGNVTGQLAIEVV